MTSKRQTTRKKTRRKGRPTTPRAERKHLLSEGERIEFRVLPSRKEAYEAQAAKDGRPNLSDWFRWLGDQRLDGAK